MEKICLTELKKMIKEEKEVLSNLLRDDAENRSTLIYVDKDKYSQIKDNQYNYLKSNESLQKSMFKIIKMTSLLNKETSIKTLSCDFFSGTISEAIILLKYYNEINNRLSKMLMQSHTQKMTYDGKLTKTEYFYDIEYVKEKKKTISDRIQKLQMEIDKKMLLSEVEFSLTENEIEEESLLLFTV